MTKHHMYPSDRKRRVSRETHNYGPVPHAPTSINEQCDWWARQRDEGDAKFAAAMRAAGYQEGASVRPGTERPRRLPHPAVSGGQSNANFS